jgi:Membrane-associated phospholipid phosphatase
MTKNAGILLLVLLLAVLNGVFSEVHAQYASLPQERYFEDTTLKRNHSPFPDPFYKETFDNKLQRITTSKAFQIAYIPAGLFLLADIASYDNYSVRTSRNFNIPQFSNHYDDYLQYAPGVLTYALKACGVEGRSSWGRLATSTGISLAIMGATVNTLKTTIHKERPDNSANNSFPSGHSAMAFMAATWLHKEYGVTQSPIYSVLGYATATSIAIGRVMNNKHWLSDVLTGAGVGILSSELGYYFGDMIYGDKGISSRAVNQTLPPMDAKPSFWSITSGNSTRNNTVDLADNTTISVKTGFYVATEGAWFLTPYFGIGGKVAEHTHILEPENPELIMSRPFFNGSIDHVESGIMSVYTIQVGPYLSLPITRRFALGCDVIGGYSGTTSSSILLAKKKVLPTDPEQTIVAYRAKSNNSFGFEAGVSCRTMVARNMGVKFFANYSLGVSRPSYSAIVDMKNGVPVYSNYKNAEDASQNLTIGIGINGYFW